MRRRRFAWAFFRMEMKRSIDEERCLRFGRHDSKKQRAVAGKSMLREPAIVPVQPPSTRTVAPMMSRSGGGEKDAAASGFDHPADAAHGNLPCRPIAKFWILEKCSGERCVEKGGADGIDANILSSEFDTHRFGEAFDGVLGHAIDGAEWRAPHGPFAKKCGRSRRPVDVSDRYGQAENRIYSAYANSCRATSSIEGLSGLYHAPEARRSSCECVLRRPRIIKTAHPTSASGVSADWGLISGAATRVITPSGEADSSDRGSVRR